MVVLFTFIKKILYCFVGKLFAFDSEKIILASVGYGDWKHAPRDLARHESSKKQLSFNIQGGPKVGIQLLNYFLCALKLPAVHFMWPKSRHTVNGENYLEILCEVVVPQLQTKPNFDELFFQQDGTSPHYALRVRDYLNKVFTQRWFGRTSSIEWPPCSPDLTPMDFFFWGVVKNKEYVKNKEKNPKTVNELKDCTYDAFREIDAN